MKDEILPIGSIITIRKKEKEDSKEPAKEVDLMIAGYLNKKQELEGGHYDYACFLYPTGLSEETALIAKEQIERVKFIGFQDNRFAVLKRQLKTYMEKKDE